ncbi:MAG TPA: TFIIB-type zinc ribbon-containing protein [Candidatus Altiarchaeales archaeon]|nr:TFIIB-type zinc ribbon-containing protein [Candidatus Altiarchaeales archaeon]
MKEKRFQFCPKCLSKDISNDLSVDSIAGGQVFNKHKCNKCGYNALLFPEMTEKEYSELKEKIDEKS